MNTRKPTKNSTKLVLNWGLKGIILIIFSLVVNNIAASDNFLDGKSYRFPIIGFLSTIILTIIVVIIAEVNFKHYKKKYFYKKVEIASIIKFIASTLGYITLMYIPANIIIELIVGGQVQYYYLLIGLLITLLVCFILIGISYSKELYYLYKLSIKDAEITIESGAKTTKLTYKNIAYFYSEDKVVYTVRNDGNTIVTDFTLNELEEKINDQLFFRANRKVIIHKDAVDQVEKIENGKLIIRLKSSIKKDVIDEINISRYKRKAFIDWFQ
mgnify:CR=1 FL=1